MRKYIGFLAVLRPLLAETDSIPIIMGGDFNVHSHLDWTEATRNLYHHGGAVVDWPVSIAMEKAGFKDSFREMNPRSGGQSGSNVAGRCGFVGNRVSYGPH